MKIGIRKTFFTFAFLEKSYSSVDTDSDQKTVDVFFKSHLNYNDYVFRQASVYREQG